MNDGVRHGRKAGESGNRERILGAARAEFAANGFRGTSLRTIASRAGVDVALLSHYFKGKDGLFAATMELPEGAVTVLGSALQGHADGAGERLARGYLSLWEDSETGPQMQVLARSALSNTEAGAELFAVLNRAIPEGRPDLGPTVTPARVSLAMSSLLGVAFSRYLTRHPYITELDFDELIREISPSIQHFLYPQSGTEEQET